MKKNGIRIEMFGDEIEKISFFEPLTGRTINSVRTVSIFPASLFVTSDEKMKEATSRIEKELNSRLEELYNRAIQKNDLKSAIASINSQMKLNGLDVQKQDISVLDNTFTIKID